MCGFFGGGKYVRSYTQYTLWYYMCEPFFIHPILLSSTHLMEDTSSSSSAVLCANQTSITSLWTPHRFECCRLLDIFLSSARFSGISVHSTRCFYIHGYNILLILRIVVCLWDKQRLSPQGSMRVLEVLLSSHHKRTAFNCLPSNHVLASSHALSFHYAFIYTHHKGEKYQNGHSFIQKRNQSY